ncbi:hypothetical protein AB0B25_07900 [Nocardia sp. NPDC049190]|uniref:hypothetical protein n=1 Tax=Nocardia sp. NPDC049190 TaxID=3155650 RepID=UPI0033CF9AFE
MRHLTTHLRDLDSAFGGGVAVDPASAALDWGIGALNRGVGRTVQPDLHVALADLAKVAGWAHHDSGQQSRARERLAQGLEWALLSSTREGASLAGNMVFALARVALHQHDPVSALKLVQFGQIPAAEAGDVGVRAQLQATAAWAYAMMGRPREMADSLSRAEHDMQLAAANEPSDPWMRVFHCQGDFAGHKALVHGVMAAHTTDRVLAESSATTALELTDMSLAESSPDRPVRSLIFDRIVAAQSAFRTGDVDTGVKMAAETLSETRVISSRRAVERLPQITAAAAPHTRFSAVADLIHEFDLAVDSV